MNSHIQLNEAGEFLRYIPAGIPIEWDADNYCTAFALEADGKSEQFNVHQFYSIGEPAYDEITQGVREVNPVLRDGTWTQQWEVFALDEETVAANQAAKEQADRERAKDDRQLAVSQIKVTTQSGNTFDGDETSQTRMARAIIALQATGTPSVTWVLADNTAISATAAELSEALALAGAAQAAIWVI